jgi:benzoate/toluate 1,2-dioxygenase reductase subunit
MLGKIAETGSAYPIHLGYGVTNDFDLVGVERLEDFAVKIPGFTFFTCVAAEKSAHPRKGYVTAHIEAASLNGGDVDSICVARRPWWTQSAPGSATRA